MTRSALKPRTALELGIMCGYPPPPEKRPDLSNWDLAPFNRWSFLNARKLFPTVEVSADPGRSFALATDLRELGSLEFENHAGQPTRLKDYLQNNYTDGFLVMHRGKIINEAYYNGMQADTPHLSQSLAKSLVGVLTGILHGRGLVDLEAPLVDYVPELKDCGYRDATLRHALDMTSGVRFIEDYDRADSDMRRVDIASGWRPAPASGSVSTIRDIILTLPKIRPHGERFEYRSIEADVVAWVLERAADQSLASLLSELVWKKIGAEQHAYFTVDRAMTALADGGFNASLRDYARFALLMQNNGRVGKEQVLPERWVDESSQGDNRVYGAPYTETCPSGGYRNFWWTHNLVEDDLMARGVFGQMIYIDRALQLIIVKLSTWPDYLIRDFTRDSLNAFRAIREAVA